MAGHSKWANIKHRKAAQDARRGKLYTRLIREITVSARLGGAIVDDNSRLRTVLDKALAANMPRDTIDRAIRRGAGGLDADALQEMTYEGYAPGGVAVLVEALTDNRNRTAAEVRYAFSHHGGSLGTDGSVAYLFRKRGVLLFGPGVDEEQIMEIALSAAAEDLESAADGSLSVFSLPEHFAQLCGTLTAHGCRPDHAEVTMVPSIYVACTGDHATRGLKLLESLDELDDVQNVFHNGDFPVEMLVAAH